MNHAAATRSTATSSPTEGTAAPGLRVLLVGQTGLDQTLRREPGVELLRARTSFEAVGELGSPIDAESPADAVVIVAPGTVTPDELKALSAALRRVEPGVCVVGLLDSAASRLVAPDPIKFGLDAWVTPPISAGVLRLLVANRDTLPAAASTPATAIEPPARAPIAVEQAQPPAVAPPPIPSAAQPASPAKAPSPSIPAQSTPTPDAAPIQAILAGSDLITACLSILRARPGLASVAFLNTSTGEAPSLVTHADPSITRVPVVHRGHLFGTLAGPVSAAAELRQSAEWMAMWLALREQQSQLRRAAFTDPLTSAWNRRYFDGFLARAIAEARTHRRDLTVLLFDIDNFKHYNDRFGHAAGDEILTETVRLLKSVVRTNDRVCRVGGDEFAVIFQEREGPREGASQHPSSILDLAKRFQAQIAQTRFPKLTEAAPGPLAISGGLATYPWDGHDAESLMNHADRLLRDSKTRGKNVIRIGPGAMRALGTDDSSSPA